MAHSQSEHEVLDLLAALSGALASIRLYPSESNIVKSSLIRIHLEIAQILEQELTLEYALADKKLMVQGVLLPQKIQKTPRVSAFVEIMTGLGVKRIIFKKGVSEKELYCFLNILQEHAEQMPPPPGRLPSDMEKLGITHIYIVEKGFMDPAGFEQETSLVPFTQYFMELVEDGDLTSIDAILKQLERTAASDDPAIRKAAAVKMTSLDEKLSAPGHSGLRFEITKILLQWLQLETVAYYEFELAADRLMQFAGRLIRTGHKEKARRIIEIFHRIATGKFQKGEAFQSLAENRLGEMANEEIFSLLLKDLPKESRFGLKEDLYTLVILGTRRMDRILDRLLESRSMSERNRIIQIITQMGPSAVPSILQRMKKNRPWFYIRNLVLLLGRLGNENELPTLEHFLVYPDYRIQREAIKSIQQIGGQDVGRILFDNFDQVDQSLQPYMISVIGALQYRPAIPRLIELLTLSMATRSGSDRQEIREKACEALGRMKAEEAVSALEQIIRRRGFFRKEHPENVRYAAAKALGEIKGG
jgi:HEAT repeat protein